MIDLKDKQNRPDLEKIGDYVQNPVFMRFCNEVKELYKCVEQIEYSSCSLEKGWNVKFKSAGRALCTVYPRELYFTVMVVAGKKEKESAEAMLPECTPEFRDIYNNTREFNGQRWLMIDLEDENGVYRDVFRFLEIRKKPCVNR